MTMKPFAIVALVLVPLASFGGAALAESPAYTIEDVTACSQDAMKLCRDKLPDLDAIETCMKAHYDSLRPACKARFDREK